MKLQRILLICALIVGIPLVAYAIGVPDKYIQGLFLLLPAHLPRSAGIEYILEAQPPRPR